MLQFISISKTPLNFPVNHNTQSPKNINKGLCLSSLNSYVRASCTQLTLPITPHPTCQKVKWLLSPGPGPETYQCSCYPHTPNNFKSLYSSLSHCLFYYPLHCSRHQRCLLYYPFIPRLSRPLCFYLDWSIHGSQWLTWTVLQQVFCDSPHFFGQALASELTSLDLTPSTVLQYVDDLLLGNPSLTHSQQHTIQFNFLADQGYLVSPTKVQLSLPRVTYLGFLLTSTKRYITTHRKSLISTLPLPTSKTEILSFLGLAEYLRLWIPNFTLLAQPLYQATQEIFQNP